MIRIFVCLALCFLYSQTPAQYLTGTSAKASGMAYTAVTLSDEWSGMHNIAGVSGCKKISIGLAYKNEYAVSALRESALCFSTPIRNQGGAAFTFFTKGNDWYRRTAASLGYAHSIGFMKIGIQVGYYQYALENLSIGKNLIVSVGGLAEIVPNKLFFGTTLTNINQAKSKGELLPVVIQSGISYRPHEKILLNVELEKDILYKPTVKVGMQYEVLSKIFVRTGFRSLPTRIHFGAGIRHHRIQIDYAQMRHSWLGNSHHLSLTLSLSRK